MYYFQHENAKKGMQRSAAILVAPSQIFRDFSSIGQTFEPISWFSQLTVNSPVSNSPWPLNKSTDNAYVQG